MTTLPGAMPPHVDRSLDTVRRILSDYSLLYKIVESELDEMLTRLSSPTWTTRHDAKADGQHVRELIHEFGIFPFFDERLALLKSWRVRADDGPGFLPGSRQATAFCFHLHWLAHSHGFDWGRWASEMAEIEPDRSVRDETMAAERAWLVRELSASQRLLDPAELRDAMLRNAECGENFEHLFTSEVRPLIAIALRDAVERHGESVAARRYGITVPRLLSLTGLPPAGGAANDATSGPGHSARGTEPPRGATGGRTEASPATPTADADAVRWANRLAHSDRAKSGEFFPAAGRGPGTPPSAADPASWIKMIDIGGPLAGIGPKQRELFALLAAAAPKGMPIKQLAEQMRYEAGRLGVNALDRARARMKKDLDSVGLTIETVGGQYVLRFTGEPKP